MRHNRSRGRLLAAAIAGAALATGGSVVATGPAQSAAPGCDEAQPVSAVTKGDLVTGKTVDGVNSATVPEDFDGEVLGVVENGIAPGLDMVMVELSSPEIDRVGGIWQGMSGSPVYAQNGKLIGAVAYGLALGPSPVAGVTPFEDMDDYLAAAPAGRIKVSDAQARTIARETSATRAQAVGGFRQLGMPLSLSGLSAQRLHKAQTAEAAEGHHLFKGRWAAGMAGSSAASSATAADIVPGGNLAASISYGDITAAGVGTATSTCDGKVVGFGHPMTFAGQTSLGLSPADAIYVQEDPTLAPFKVANVGAPVGTITDDHLTGITGAFGASPEATDISSTVTFGSRNRTGTSHSLDPRYNADITFSQVLANHDRVVDGIMPGSEAVSYEANGTDADGNPFTISLDDVYQSNYDISFEGIFDVADITYALSRMEGVDVDDVTADADVSDDTTAWRIASVERKQGDAWAKLSRRHPLKAHRGDVIKLRAILKSQDDSTTTVPLQVKVPQEARRFGFLMISGGASTYNRGIWRADTPQELADALAEAPANNEVQASLEVFRRRSDQVQSVVSEPQTHVVNGRKYAEVRILR